MTQQKTVFISGATGDFGKAFASRFAQNNDRLILHGRSEDKLNALKSELENSYDSPCHTCIIDLTKTDDILSNIAALPQEFQNVDILINNAGGAIGAASAEKEPLDDWLTMIDINVKGLVSLTHALLGNMVQNKAGHIINIGSTAGNYPYPGGHVYCASKAFVKQFSLALRADLYNKNIRVSNIEPGMVETQFSKVRFKGNEKAAEAVYAGTEPLQAEDIAEAVFWTASLPDHMNINRMEIMPTKQAPGPLLVDRGS